MVNVVKWTKARNRKLTRRKDGTFKKWAGGYKLSEMKKKQNNFHGIAIHIGKEYKRQHGRPAKVGSIVRTKRQDGKFHKGAYWYIRTSAEWRRSPTHERKPSRAVIMKVMLSSRTGRP